MYIWDSANVEHIARHNITPEEAEQVIENDPIDLDIQFRSGEKRIPHLGVTDAGRTLFVVTTIRGRSIRVVTAYPADARSQKFYATVRAKEDEQNLTDT